MVRYEATLDAGSKGAMQQWRLVTEEMDLGGRFNFGRMLAPSVPSFAATPLLAGQVSLQRAICSAPEEQSALRVLLPWSPARSSLGLSTKTTILPWVQGLVIKVTQDLSGILTESLLRPLLLMALYSPPSFAAAPLLSSPAAVSAAGGTARPLRFLLFHSDSATYT